VHRLPYAAVSPKQFGGARGDAFDVNGVEHGVTSP
jgi:hypothetical protein